MRSRTVNAPVSEEEKRTEVVPSEPMLPCRQKDEHPRTPTIESVFGNRLISTPHATSIVPIKDAASPAELAKAYMGNRNSNASSSLLGMRNPALREDPTPIKSEYFPYKSPIMSIVPRATKHAAVHENGFVTPRSHGRSAIYSMARTPYARVYSSSTLKCGRLPIQGEPSSSTQSALGHDMVSGSTQGVLKRRSLALDNGIGSVGPIRRVRHKSNLLYSKLSDTPLFGSALSVSRSGLGIDAAQKPSTSMQKPILPDEVKHSPIKSSEENVDDNKPSMSFPPFSSKSSETASKILHQLDKLVSPKEKSPESRLPVTNDNSSLKLSPSMLHGQALRSMDMADSSKSLDNLQGNKFDGTFRNLCASAQNQKFVSDREKVENGSLKLHAPSDELVPVVAATDATKPRNQVMPTGKTMDADMIKSGSHPTQKRRAFCMSAHKNFLDLNDDSYPNGAVSFPPKEEKASFTAKAEKISSGSEALAQENSSTLSVVMPSKSLATDGEAHARTASIMSSISDPIYKSAPSAVMAVTMTSFGSNKPASPDGSIANPSLFNFGNKMVSSTELTVIGAPSKEVIKAAPMFDLENVVSSKVPGADAPLVNFGTNENVHRVPPMPFTASTSVGESTPKIGISSDSHLGSSISSTTVTGATDSMRKVCESDNGNAETNTDAGLSAGASELAVSSAATSSSLTSPTSIFTFGQSSNQNKGFLASGPSFSSFPSLISNNCSSSTSLSHSAGCGDNATAAPTGISTAAPANVLSNSSSVFGAQASPSASGFATYTQTQSVPNASLSSGRSLLSSSSSAADVSFSSGSSLFTPFSSATNTSFSAGSSLLPLSSTTNIFNSGTTFGLSTSASSSAVNSISSNGSASSTLFGTSSWQPNKSPFGSTFSSSSSSGFSVGASTASFASVSSPMMFSLTTSASAPQFSFTSAAATTSTQSASGSPIPVFSFASAPVNNHQISMAEDRVQTTPPVTPAFCHPPSPVQSNFVFGASCQSGTNPFQLGNQPNVAPQNPSPFQASGGLEFNSGGGSFSLGSGGGDKSGRKFLRVKHKQRTKK